MMCRLPSYWPGWVIVEMVLYEKSGKDSFGVGCVIKRYSIHMEFTIYRHLFRNFSISLYSFRLLRTNLHGYHSYFWLFNLPLRLSWDYASHHDIISELLDDDRPTPWTITGLIYVPIAALWILRIAPGDIIKSIPEWWKGWRRPNGI